MISCGISEIARYLQPSPLGNRLVSPFFVEGARRAESTGRYKAQRNSADMVKCRASTGLTAMRLFEMPGRWKQGGSLLARYLLPFATVSAALGLQLALAWMLPKGVEPPYVVLYLAALCLTAWFGGYVPGVIAC